MKALSIWQPWASAIACGAKQIETRGWRTWYRGSLAIHAGKRWSVLGASAMRSVGLNPLEIKTPLGCIVAIADLRDCVPTDRFDDIVQNMHHRTPRFQLSQEERMLGDFTPGRFGWILANVRPLDTPIHFTGRQGLFNVPDDLIPGKYR